MPASFAQSAHTLPRNFTFHYSDGQPPRTPEPFYPEERAQPPPPPAPVPRGFGEPYRLRRRRQPIPSAQRPYRAIPPQDIASDSSDLPLPSIEIFHAPTGLHHIELSASSEAHGLHPATNLDLRLHSPPKTPVAQTYGVNEVCEREEFDFGAEDSSSQGESVTRPSTACSGFSNSSKASSIESFPSLGAPCISPEVEGHPFDFPLLELKRNSVSSPLGPYGQSTTVATPVQQQKPGWTEDMDNHIWITYMRYLQDPTHTPFKMLPGTAPPLGVCSRVVREAKRTWKGTRTTAVPRAYQFARWGSNRASSQDKGDANGALSSSDQDNRKPHAAWPRSDAATRKRLRDLCKRKPTLSAHYNRLLHTRSPSPFHSSSQPRSTSIARELLSPPPRFGDSNTFSTRDMNISLATSISSTMHPGAPLTQLTSDAVTPRPRADSEFVLSNTRSPGHQKSQSLHFGLGSHQSNTQGLASPFRPTNIFSSARKMSENDVQVTVPSSNGPSLAPPVELHAPVPRRSMFKRPAQHELEDAMNSEDPFTRQTHLMRELFGPPTAATPEPAHRRVRSRGFSLGDMSSSTRLSNLFTPPTAPEPMGGVTQTSTTQALPQSGLQPSTSIDGLIRLGSPFAEKPAKQHFNTFPRNFSLQGLEPAMETGEDGGVPLLTTEMSRFSTLPRP